MIIAAIRFVARSIHSLVLCLVALSVSSPAWAEHEWRRNGDPALPSYPTPEAACVIGEAERAVAERRAADHHGCFGTRA